MEDLKVYTYRPVSEGECVTARAVYGGRCGTMVNLKKQSTLGKFPNCRLNSFGSVSPPYISSKNYNNDTGIVVILLQFISKHLGVKMNATIGTKSGEVYLQTRIGQNDMMFGTFTTINNIGMFDPIFYMLQDEIAMFVALARPKSQWFNIIYIFNFEVWMGTIASLFAVAVTWHLISTDSTWDTSLLQIFCALISSPKQVQRFQMFFLLWCICSFILNQSYQAYLSSFMFKPALKRQVKNLRHVMEDNLETGGVPHNRFIFDKLDVHNEEADHYKKRYTNCSIEGSECYKRSINGDFGFLVVSRKIMYHLSKNKSHYLYRLPTVGVRHLFMFMPKRSPYIKRFQEQFDTLLEVGLQQHFDVHQWKPRRPVYTAKSKSVNLQQLALIYLVYFCGLGISFLCFVVEIYNGPPRQMFKNAMVL